MTPEQLESARANFEQYVIENTSCEDDLLSWSLRRNGSYYVSQLTNMMWDVWLYQQEKIEKLTRSDYIKLPENIEEAKCMRAVAVKYLEQFSQ